LVRTRDFEGESSDGNAHVHSDFDLRRIDHRGACLDREEFDRLREAAVALTEDDAALRKALILLEGEIVQQAIAYQATTESANIQHTAPMSLPSSPQTRWQQVKQRENELMKWRLWQHVVAEVGRGLRALYWMIMPGQPKMVWTSLMVPLW
jgi:hypothetical protein